MTHLKKACAIRGFYMLVFSLMLSMPAVGQQHPENTPDTLFVPPPDSLDYYEMSIEQLLSLKAHGVPSELEALINSLISVASKKALSSRESPGIVTLITKDEIEKMGARDLIDVLRLVPGLDFAADVQGVVGIGSRGNWAHEGKMLLLIDGQQMNEILYSTLQFGNHYPVDNIKRIEIIRGPGSAIYGGYAEYGVINIITKEGGDINGVAVSATVGAMRGTFARTNLNVLAGRKLGDFNISLNAFRGLGNRSDQHYTDFDGNSYNMAEGNGQLDPMNLNLGMSYKGLSFRAIYDDYKTTTRDAFSNAVSRAYDNNFQSLNAELKYEYKWKDKIVITPRISYVRQFPWKNTVPIQEDDAGSYFVYHRLAERLQGAATLSWKATRRINIIAGAEAYQDQAAIQPDDEAPLFYNGTPNVSFFNYAFFTEAVIRHRILNVTLGGRYDKHSVYGDALNPRIALTKKINRLHFKALYANSFRAPAIENINYSVDGLIRPERTTVAEFEVGYALTKRMILTVNAFDISTKYPILYSTIEDVEYYQNFPHTGTRGIEVEYRYKDNRLHVAANYAFYMPAGNVPEPYTIRSHPEYLVGFAPHKVNVMAHFDVTKNFSINATANIIGDRYAFTGYDPADSTSGLAARIAPTTLVNIFVRYTDLFVTGLNVGLGCYDLFDERISYIQAYNSLHAPLPGTSREILLKLEYVIQSKKNKKP